MSRTLPLSIIGAMQRSAPQLTSLWLEWTGIHDLHRCTFDIAKGANTGPATIIRLPNAASNPTKTWKDLASVFRVPVKTLSTKEIYIGYNTNKVPHHENFWKFVTNREERVAAGPLEWWWVLAQLRLHSVQAASSALFTTLGLNQNDFRDALIEFVNPTLSTRGVLKTGQYVQPIALDVICPEEYLRRATLRIDLTKSQERVSKALLEVALAR